MNGPPPGPDGFDILLVEDTASMRTIYEAHLRRAGYATLSAATAGEALALFEAHDFAVVLLDLMLPDRDGLDLLVDLMALRPATAVVVVAAERSVERTVTAIRRGAQDFLVKPVTEARLMQAVEAARNAASLAQPPHSPAARGGLGDFIGTSAPMREVYDRIRAAARSLAPVCISGESGTGKELAAQAIHRLSPRAQGPFVTLDCGAIAPERLDSEVFGHRRGAVAGASSDKPGAAELADGGTLFLDDICELHPAVQPKLLRFLQSGLVHPLGAETAQRVNLRLISASAMPPYEAVRSGRLREDLYYRLHVVPLQMPPLRERPEDIGPMAEAFLHRFAALEGRGFRRIAPRALALMRAHSWPGNVRELTNVLRAATVMHDGEELSPEMLPPTLHNPPPAATPAAAAVASAAGFAGLTLAEVERAAIGAALARHDGSVPRAAHDLGVAPSTLYRKLESWRKA